MVERYRMRHIHVSHPTGPMTKRLESYLEVLTRKSEELDVSLADAFKWKDISNTTLWRTLKGKTELRFETARQVNHALYELHALRKHREELKKSRQERSV